MERIQLIFSFLLLFVRVKAEGQHYYDCYPDATGAFYVAGTEGNGMRFCDWAGRANTEERCKLEIVSWQCPVTCNVPCNDPNNSHKVSSQNDEEDTIPETIIASCTLVGVVASILLASFLIIQRRRKESEHDSHYFLPEEDIPEPIRFFELPEDDEESGHEPKNVFVKARTLER